MPLLSSRFAAQPPPRWIVPRGHFWLWRSARRNSTYRLWHPRGCDNMFCRAAARTFAHGGVGSSRFEFSALGGKPTFTGPVLNGQLGPKAVVRRARAEPLRNFGL